MRNEQISAIYENGILRPLPPVSLAESQVVTLTISGAESVGPELDLDYVEYAKAEVARFGLVPSIEEIRAMVVQVPGSFSEDVIAERGG